MTAATPRRAIRGAALAATLAFVLGASGTAHADFTAPQLVSGTATLQADYGFEPAASGDGQYVAFTGSFAGQPGIYRKNLATGAMDLVAAGGIDLVTGSAPANLTGSPSISADGQYVAFTTTAANPATGTGAQCSSVYVRNMSLPITSPGAFTLASALDGTMTGLTYAGSYSGSPPSQQPNPGCPGGGSATAPGVALSADGTEVAFTVVGESNLTTGAGGPVTTPPAQVVVRDLATGTTTLVSQTLASLGATPQPVPGGAAMIDASTTHGSATLATQAQDANADPDDSTAAISADGSTVAWLGIDVPEQTQAAAVDGPTSQQIQEGDVLGYDEPLWRRVAGGPGAPIRRVLGDDSPAGPLDLQWPVTNGAYSGGPVPQAFTGSLTPTSGLPTAVDLRYPTDETGAVTIEQATPKLSADGSEVSVLASAPPVGECAVGSLVVCTGPPPPNAYLVDMAPGLTRAQAVTALTAWGSTNFAPASSASVDQVAVSPDGSQIAFTTERTQFALASPTLLGESLATTNFDQLYVVNVDDGTFELVSAGYDNLGADESVQSPSFSDDGTIALASGAANLVYGAASDIDAPGIVGTEAFVVGQAVPAAGAGVTAISAAPAALTFTSTWALHAVATANRDGGVTLTVDAPGAGTLSASAASTLTGLALPRHPRPRSLHLVTPRAVVRLVSSGVTRVRLVPTGRYRKLIDRHRGLYALVTVRLTAPGQRALTQTLPVDFRRLAAGARRATHPRTTRHAKESHR